MRRCRLLSVCLTLMFGTVLPGSAAADNHGSPLEWLDPVRAAAAVTRGVAGLQQLEAVRMGTAIAKGSQMGPGDGWFGPSRSRYDWNWLAARQGVEPDERISERKFRGPKELFARLDRDGDGFLSRSDFDWSPSSPFVRQNVQAGTWFRRFDANANGRLSRAEWEALYDRMAGDKGFVTPEDLRRALFPPAPPRQGPPGGGPSPGVLLYGLLSGELGSVFEGPGLNRPAPDFTLPREDGKGTLTFSAYRGDRPAVLVFGSFT